MILLFLLLAGVTHADSTVQPCDHAKLIYAQEIAPKSSSSSLVRNEDVCTIRWTPKAGQTISFTDKQAPRAAIIAELSALEDKLDAGTITNAELRRLIKIVLKLARMSKDP